MTTLGMSCHTWALSGSTVTDAGATVNRLYTNLMNQIGSQYDYGANLQGKTLAQVRQETITKLLDISEGRKKELTNHVFLCGGFREGQVCPEHVWLEDHTTKKTYDTFINQSVRSINSVGKSGQAFKPPCEATAFNANEIARVQLNGYTDGQYASLP